MTRHVSYWLVPAAPQRNVLQELIATLSRTHSAPVFVPHVTIYSGASAPDEHPLDIMTQATRGVHGFSLQVDRILYTPRFTKTLFVQFHASETLHRLTEAMRRLSSQPSGYVLDAHLSLLYKHMAEEAQQRLAASVQLPMAEILFDAVWANASEGGTHTAEDVRRWQIVARQRLQTTP